MAVLEHWRRCRTTAAPDHPRAGPNADDLVDPARVAALLRRATRQRSLLDVTIAGVDGRLNSALLEVSRRGGCLALDELTPSDGHRAVVPGTALRVAGRLAGVEFGFQVCVGEICNAAGVAYYRAPLPASVRHRQRRDAVRTVLGAGTVVMAQLHPASEPPLGGELRDVSPGGMNVRVRAERAPRRGLRVPEWVIEAPDGEPIAGAAEIRRVQALDRAGLYELGCRFVSLPRTERRKLERFIAALQREKLRRARRLDHPDGG